MSTRIRYTNTYGYLPTPFSCADEAVKEAQQIYKETGNPEVYHDFLVLNRGRPDRFMVDLNHPYEKLKQKYSQIKLNRIVSESQRIIAAGKEAERIYYCSGDSQALADFLLLSKPGRCSDDKRLELIRKYTQ